MSKISLYILCSLALAISIAYAQNDGQYRPSPTKRSPTKTLSAQSRNSSPSRKGGKETPINDGKKSAANNDNDGKYRPLKEPKFLEKRFNINVQPGIARKPKLITRPKGKALTGGRPGVNENDFQVDFSYDQNGANNGYNYLYKTDTGISAEEEGKVMELSTGEGVRATGFYEYPGDDGVLYRVDYVADDGGFAPQGAHLHPTPRHVIKLLEYLALNAKK